MPAGSKFWQLEIIKMCLYMAFPVTTFWIFNQPEVLRKLGFEKEKVELMTHLNTSENKEDAFCLTIFIMYMMHIIAASKYHEYCEIPPFFNMAGTGSCSKSWSYIPVDTTWVAIVINIIRPALSRNDSSVILQNSFLIIITMKFIGHQIQALRKLRIQKQEEREEKWREQFSKKNI